MQITNSKLFLLVLVLVLSFSILLQETNGSDAFKCEWYQIWDGSYGDEVGGNIGIDSSEDIYIAGYSYIYMVKDADMILVKYDENGVVQWNRTWGGIADDICNGLTMDSSDNIFLVGSTESFGAGDKDMVLVKYNGNGTQQWNTTWGGVDSDRCYGGSTDSSGNVYLVGVTSSFGLGNEDIALVKFDENGLQKWNRTWGGSYCDFGHGVTVDSSDNVYLTGQSDSFGAGDHDIVLIKYDNNGILQWNTTWGGDLQDIGYGIVVDSSDNVYLTGITSGYPFESDAVLVKYDKNGVEQWNRTWGGINQEFGKALAVDSSDNVYLMGNSEGYGVRAPDDMFLVKYDQNGTQQWNCMWGGADDDICDGGAVDLSDNVYLAGWTQSFGTGDSSIVLVKYSPYIAITSIPSYNFFIIIVIFSISTFLLRKKIIYKKSN